LTDPLLAIYPGAFFFALVLHRETPHESYRRQGVVRASEEFPEFFNAVAR
jgi:hypothetical protein